MWDEGVEWVQRGQWYLKDTRTVTTFMMLYGTHRDRVEIVA